MLPSPAFGLAMIVLLGLRLLAVVAAALGLTRVALAMVGLKLLTVAAALGLTRVVPILCVGLAPTAVTAPAAAAPPTVLENQTKRRK